MSEESAPYESELVQVLRKKNKLYRDFANEVVRIIKQDIDVVPELWRAIGRLLFNLKLHRESERVKGESK